MVPSTTDGTPLKAFQGKDHRSIKAPYKVIEVAFEL